MTCYICSSKAANSIKIYDNIIITYCDDHRAEATIGISDYVLSGTLDRLEGFKLDYLNRYNSSTYKEFEKCKSIEKFMLDNDSSVTEQAI